MSMPASVTWHVRHVLHTVRIGHSVLIGFHVIHPNTSLSSVNQHLLLIRYSIAIIAMQIFVTFRENTAPVATPGLGLLNAKYTFKGTPPANHFCTDRPS